MILKSFWLVVSKHVTAEVLLQGLETDFLKTVCLAFKGSDLLECWSILCLPYVHHDCFTGSCVCM